MIVEFRGNYMFPEIIEQPFIRSETNVDVI